MMNRLQPRTHLLLVALLSLLLGCDSSTEPSGDGGTNQGGDNPPAGSAPLDGVDTYVAGLEKPGDMFTVRLVTSTPVPKDTGLYTWEVQVLDADMAPICDAEVVAEPTMPAHGHGTFPETTAGVPSDDCGYQFPDMDLFMPGVWQIEVRVTAGGDEDTVFYNFDLEG